MTKPELKREEFSTIQVLMLLYHISKQANEEGYFGINIESPEGKQVGDEVERLKELGIAEEKEISGKKIVRVDRSKLLQLAKDELGEQSLRH